MAQRPNKPAIRYCHYMDGSTEMTRFFDLADSDSRAELTRFTSWCFINGIEYLSTNVNEHPGADTFMIEANTPVH